MSPIRAEPGVRDIRAEPGFEDRGTAASRACIVMFGAGVRADGSPTPTLSRRIDAAVRFGEALRVAPLYIPSGGIGRHGPSEASVMAAALRRAGVPDARILIEDTARDTLDSVFASRTMLRRLGHAGPVYAASSAYHLPRCVLLLRLAGLPARAVPPPPEPAAQGLLRRWRWRLREVPALPWDALLLLGRETIDRVLTKR